MKEERKNLLLPGVPRWPLDPEKPVIELREVSKSFGDLVILDKLSIKIIPGRTTVIVGRSGSGKSVLLKLMMGLLKPDSGEVFLFGKNLSELTDPEILEVRKRMGMLFQNYALFDSLSVTDNIGFTLNENSNVPSSKVSKLAQELVDIMGLQGSELSLPSELSGGMKKRVSLSRALIANPEVVLFDEPTTGLDPVMIEKVDEMICLAKEEFKITSVIISHDMASTKRLADTVAFLDSGKIVFEGTHQEFLTSNHASIRNFMDGARTTRLSSDEISKEAKDDQSFVPIVELVGVHKHFGTKHVLKGVNLKIPPNKITVLIGGSGSGKSVIIKHIMGLFKPTEGEVKVFGENTVPYNDDQMAAMRRRFGLVFQHAALLDWLSIAGNVGFPLRERTNSPESEIEDRVAEVLKRLNLTDVRNRMPGEVSEGQKKRAAIARAIIMNPEIMIYDEPTTGQDPLRTASIDRMVKETQEQFQITSIVISHDMASTFRIGHNIALLNMGQIAAVGTPAEIHASEDAYVRSFIHAGAV